MMQKITRNRNYIVHSVLLTNYTEDNFNQLYSYNFFNEHLIKMFNTINKIHIYKYMLPSKLEKHSMSEKTQ